MIDNLNELQKSTLQSTATFAQDNIPKELSGARLSYEEQKERNKRLKKLERRVADCEAEISQTEAALAIVEQKMATPEGASDMSLYEQYRKLKEQLGRVMDEWEATSLELEAGKANE